jgi:hypothetical protein
MKFKKRSIPLDIEKASEYFEGRTKKATGLGFPFFDRIGNKGPGRRIYLIHATAEEWAQSKELDDIFYNTNLERLFIEANREVRPKKNPWRFSFHATREMVTIHDETDTENDDENFGPDAFVIYAENISCVPYLIIEAVPDYEPLPQHVDEILATIQMFASEFKKRFGVNLGKKAENTAENMERLRVFENTKRGRNLPENVVRKYIQQYTFKHLHRKDPKKVRPATAFFKDTRGGTRRKRRN